MVLLCLTPDDDEDLARAHAEELARTLDARVQVLRLLAPGDRAQPEPGAWALRAAEPEEPLLRFARVRRAKAVVFGPRAWARAV